MKRVISILTVVLLTITLVGCSNEVSRPKYKYTKNYTMTYFYLNDCSNCKHFKKDVLPVIKKEFKSHMTYKGYDMDDDSNNNEVKTVYDEIIAKIDNFDNDDYGYGPFVVVDNYVAILGVGDKDDYVDNLSKILRGKKVKKMADDETVYYFK
ncbi:MAG: hypothetical protein PHH04_07290 [Thomasclavelia sp.]|jgi:hypothetical protein|nr:hypothetical protein [Thomasclavelia sp.]